MDGRTDGYLDGRSRRKNKIMGNVTRIISGQKSSKSELFSGTFGHVKVSLFRFAFRFVFNHKKGVLNANNPAFNVFHPKLLMDVYPSNKGATRLKLSQNTFQTIPNILFFGVGKKNPNLCRKSCEKVVKKL